jgi:hypothetical protein
VVTGFDLGYSASNPFHNSCALMAQHDRLRHGKLLVAHGDIRVTNPGGDDSNEDLVVPWF